MDHGSNHVISIDIKISSTNSPRYVVPADDKGNARLIVSQIVLDTFEGLKMTRPKTNAKRRKELQLIRKRLAKRNLRTALYPTRGAATDAAVPTCFA